MSVSFQDIYKQPIDAAWGNTCFSGFNLDSRTIQAGQIFIALNSYSQPEKTRVFAENALKAGAIGIISEQVLGLENEWVCADVRFKMGQWQRDYLSQTSPVNTARVIAVTGTNGKTTIARLVAELISLQQQRCAVFGTTGNGILPDLTPSSHTTLDALQLQTLLHDFAAQGAQFASLEASSHGLEQGRLNGSGIEIAIYSNLSRDHLDYHGTLEAYAKAKSQLFAFESLKFAIINLDDAHAQIMLDAAQRNPAQPVILTYSLKNKQADYFVDTIHYALEGAHIVLRSPQGVFDVQSPFLGQFNVENLIASLIAVQVAGFDLAQLIASVPKLKGAPGRMQVIRDGERLFVVDYAHTPDALTQVLSTLKRHTCHQLWAVFGCGGDRDRGKRPLMTQAALTGANRVVLTSDNPRTEAPEQIFADMQDSIDLTGHDVVEIGDRREAIKFAVNEAKNGDIIVIAGKGHENYQEINGIRHWFDDVIEVQSALQAQAHSNDAGYPAK